MTRAFAALFAFTACGAGHAGSGTAESSSATGELPRRAEPVPHTVARAEDKPPAAMASASPVPPASSTAPSDDATAERQETMAVLCRAMAQAVSKNAASCDAMGRALTELFEPNLELIHAYQASVVSKAPGRAFAAAESRCNTSLQSSVLKTFWACKDDAGVQAAFQHMNALKP